MTILQTVLNRTKDSTTQIGNSISSVTEPWQKLPITLRSYFLLLQNFIWTVLTIYVLALLGLIATSPLFGKNIIVEAGLILRNLGFSLLSSTAFLIIGVSFGFLSTIFLKPFLPSQLQLPNILNILGWQGIWSTVWVMSPAIIFSIVAIVVGFVVNIVPSKR
jgi:hypothetical protein